MLTLLLACADPVPPPPPLVDAVQAWDLTVDASTTTISGAVPWPGAVGDPPELTGLTGRNLVSDMVVVAARDGSVRWIGRPDDDDQWLVLEAAAGWALPFPWVTRDSLPSLARGDTVTLPADLVLARELLPIEVRIDPGVVTLEGLPAGLSGVHRDGWTAVLYDDAGGTLELGLRPQNGRLRLAPERTLVADVADLTEGLARGCFGPSTVERDIRVGPARWVARWSPKPSSGRPMASLLDPEGNEHVVTHEMPVGTDRVWRADDATLTLVGAGSAWAGSPIGGLPTWRAVFTEPSGIAACSLELSGGRATCELGEIRLEHGDCTPEPLLRVAQRGFVPATVSEVPRDPRQAVPSTWRRNSSGSIDRLVLDAEGRAGAALTTISGHRDRSPVARLTRLGAAPEPPLPFISDTQLEAWMAGGPLPTTVNTRLELESGTVSLTLAAEGSTPVPGMEGTTLSFDHRYGWGAIVVRAWLRTGNDEEQLGSDVRVEAGEPLLILRDAASMRRPGP